MSQERGSIDGRRAGVARRLKRKNKLAIAAAIAAGGLIPVGPFLWGKLAAAGQSHAGTGSMSIAAENQRPGTTDWIPSSTSTGVVAGYVAREYVKPGEPQRLYIADQGGPVDVTVFRMGHYGGRGGREVLHRSEVHTKPQPECARSHATGLIECGWDPTLDFNLPANLPSGVFLVKMMNAAGDEGYVPFVLGPSKRQPAIAQVPTSTYQAYNAWGGGSLYRVEQPSPEWPEKGVEVSFDRPYGSCKGAVCQLIQRDLAMVSFLEQKGYPVAYVTNQAVHMNPDLLRGARAIIDIGHSEYWSGPMRNAFRRSRDRGTNLAFFSSNTMWKRIEYAPATRWSSQAGEPAHRILYYRDAPETFERLDPSESWKMAQKRWKFGDLGAHLSGTAWNLCVGRKRSDSPIKMPYTFRDGQYYDWRPDRTLRPFWVFRETGMDMTTEIPAIVGDEVDGRAAGTPRGTRVLGSSKIRCQTHGEEFHGNPRSKSETTLYRARSGGRVFSSGTMGWQLGLAPALPHLSARKPDPRLVRMTRNILDRMICEPLDAERRNRSRVPPGVVRAAAKAPPCGGA